MPDKHFLRLDDLGSDGIRQLIARAIAGKAEHAAGKQREPLRGRTLGMLFEKASTRTRVSFEAGMAQLGGHALFLSPHDTQLGRGETIEDTARVLSRMLDIVMIRNDSQDTLERFAEYASVPVINGLTERLHPCQLLADLQTFAEHRGDITGARVAWVGDGNNMCHSYIHAARLMGFSLRIAAPAGYHPDAGILASGQDNVQLVDTPQQAVSGADLVVTDTWTSMGQEAENEVRRKAFADYQVNQTLMRRADHDALFMHCLPAHRGEEVTDAVMDGPQSVIWDEAGNRLHAQKALLETLLGVRA